MPEERALLRRKIVGVEMLLMEDRNKSGKQEELERSRFLMRTFSNLFQDEQTPT